MNQTKEMTYNVTNTLYGSPLTFPSPYIWSILKILLKETPVQALLPITPVSNVNDVSMGVKGHKVGRSDSDLKTGPGVSTKTGMHCSSMS